MEENNGVKKENSEKNEKNSILNIIIYLAIFTIISTLLSSTIITLNEEVYTLNTIIALALQGMIIAIAQNAKKENRKNIMIVKILVIITIFIITIFIPIKRDAGMIVEAEYDGDVKYTYNGCYSIFKMVLFQDKNDDYKIDYSNSIYNYDNNKT